MKKIQQFDIMSFQYDRIKNANYNLQLSTKEAYRNGELIALADNECLRAIRRITEHAYDGNKLKQLIKSKRSILRQNNTSENRLALKNINTEIGNQLYISEFVCVQFQKTSDYNKLNRIGFNINGIKYRWLLCGASHQRTNRSFYCKETIYDELNHFLLCGAKSKDIILSKFNAYYALSASATHSVTRPRVCVIPDKEIKMNKLVDWVTENGNIERVNKELNFNFFDGMGLISPILARSWANDLGLDYLPSGFGIRNAFIKGLSIVFDFHKFAKEVANTNEIVDIYGKKYDINEIDLILTKSQFKLCANYDSWQDYEKFNIELGWQWGVSKIAPKVDNDYIRTNYQFLQVLDLTDTEIEELCKPTLDWIRGINGEDINQMELYLMGKVANQENTIKVWNNLEDDFVKCLIAENGLKEDTYIRNRIINSLNKRIKESYMGKLIMNGNFQLMIADPYALCEHAFGMEVKGLLKEHEHYSNYWNNRNVKEVVAMRSPLTWRSEINKLNFKADEQMQEWYKYIYSGIIYNIWGCDCMIHADSDFDGDLACTINNQVLLKAYERI